MATEGLDHAVGDAVLPLVEQPVTLWRQCPEAERSPASPASGPDAVAPPIAGQPAT